MYICVSCSKADATPEQIQAMYDNVMALKDVFESIINVSIGTHHSCMTHRSLADLRLILYR